MNERILKLLKQAGVGDNWNKADWYSMSPEMIEKFAQLIVKECAGLFPNVYVEIETDYGHTPVVAADYIKKHFGVEE